MTKTKKNDKILSEKDIIKQLEKENLYLKSENECLKIENSSSRKRAKREENDSKYIKKRKQFR